MDGRTAHAGAAARASVKGDATVSLATPATARKPRDSLIFQVASEKPPSDAGKGERIDPESAAVG